MDAIVGKERSGRKKGNFPEHFYEFRRRVKGVTLKNGSD